MATWLELSICKLVFCILSLANISFSPPPLTRFCVSPPHLSLCLTHTLLLFLLFCLTVLAFKAPLQLF